MKCILCYEQAAENHEIFYNGKINKKRCLEYNLYVPVCRKHHDEAHGKFKYSKDFMKDYKEYYQKLFCDKLDIDFENVKKIMDKTSDKWTDSMKVFMSFVKEHIERVRNDK